MEGAVMKTQSKKRIGISRQFFFTALFVCLGANVFFLNSNFDHQKNLMSLNSGVDTCMTRLGQTLTARMIGDSSSGYLGQEFTQITSDCFGDLVETSKVTPLRSNASYFNELNEINKRIATFHQIALRDIDQKTITVVASNLGTRFEKIERAIDGTRSSIESGLAHVSTTLFYQQALLLFIFFAMGGMLIHQFLRSRERKQFSAEIEKEAENYLSRGEFSSSRVQVLVKESLERRGLKYLAQLSSRFYAYHSLPSQRVTMEVPKIDQAGVAEFVDPSKVSVETIERIWGNESAKTRMPQFQSLPEQDKPVGQTELNPIVDGIIDKLSKRFFAHGVRIDMDVEDLLLIDGQHESIEQILFQSFQVVGKGVEQSEDRFLKVLTKRFGKTIILEMAASGEGFKQSFIKSQIGLSHDSEQDPIEVSIINELARDADVRITYDNHFDEQGDIIGRMVKITMTGQKGEDKKVINRVGRGTKREILEEFSKNASS